MLTLADNSLTFLPSDSFNGLPHLQTIDLTGNDLREIDPSIFRDGMGKLAYLILADNQLTVIPYQALQPLRTLKTLDLSYNRINKMSPATEPGVTISLNFQINLDILRLEYNQLKTLESVSFKYFNVLNHTYLDGNPLATIEVGFYNSLKNIQTFLTTIEIAPE